MCWSTSTTLPAMLNLMLNGPDDDEEKDGWSSVLAAAGFEPPSAEEGEVD